MEQILKEENKKQKTKKEINKQKQRRWVIIVSIGTFLSTLVITYISDTLSRHTNLFVSFIILMVIILFGIATDIVGIAVTAVTIDPFNAMAAKKIKGARTAVGMVKNASKVSSVCCDVVGDICGIVSGAIGVSMASQLVTYLPTLHATFTGILVSAAAACLTVAGKAIGKEYAMNQGTVIIHRIAVPIASAKILFKGQE